jgi:arylsulfatase A-like enzyme
MNKLVTTLISSTLVFLSMPAQTAPRGQGSTNKIESPPIVSGQSPTYAVGSMTRFFHDETRGFDTVAGRSEASLYGDVVEEIDWSTGQIIETCQELGILDNTLTIFTSDNGPWYEGSSGPPRNYKG